MSRDILISAGIGERRAALFENGRLMGVIIEQAHQPHRIDAIYAARIADINDGLDAAFVDLGGGETAFLPLREAKKLTQGQLALVQIMREAEGGKLARVTRALELPGISLVYRPGQKDTAVSRKIGVLNRGWLLGWGKEWGGNVLFRSLAERLPKDKTRAEYDLLSIEWQKISQARPEKPGLLRPAESICWRAILSWADPQPDRIIMDDADLRAELMAQMRGAPIDLPVPILHTSPVSLFSDTVEAAIAELGETRIDLPGGGWFTIEATTALTAIDVNSGAASDETPAAQAIAVNELAAEEICRQIRLRDIGGLIVIDFIGVPTGGVARDLHRLVDKAIAADPAPLRRNDISEFGTMELTRQKTGPSVMAQLNGVAADALALLRAARRETGPGRTLVIAAPQPVLDWIKRNGLDGELSRRAARAVELQIAAAPQVFLQ